MVRIAEGNGWIRNGDFIDLGPEGVRQEMYNKGRLGIVSNYLTLRVDEFGNKYDSCVQTRRGIINDTGLTIIITLVGAIPASILAGIALARCG